jgi:hypothetical protein
LDGQPIAGATARTFTLENVAAANEGAYAVTVANALGTVASTPAMLKVNTPVAITQQPASQTVEARSSVTFTVGATGTPPLAFQWYKNGAAIPAATNASLHILGVNSSDAGNYTVAVSNVAGSANSQAAVLAVKTGLNYVLYDQTPGGGLVMPEPFQSSFAPNSTATLTALPAGGWTFLDWKGHPQGTNPVVSLQMTSDKTVRARFGTSVTVQKSGNGAVSLSPLSALYPYDTPVRLIAQPDPGQYFAGWSGSAIGDANPLTMWVRDADAVIIGSFLPLPAGRVALTVIPNGYGEVSVLPYTNTFTTGQMVTNQALPAAGQEFIGWSGDVSGTNNPLVVAMNESKVIFANFTQRPHLDIESLGRDGLLLSLAGEFTAAYSLEASTNLIHWAPYMTLTNAYGEAQILESSAAGQRLFYRAATPGQARRTATAIPTLVNGFVVAITVTDGGAGYTTPPSVAITGGGGSGATATAIVLNGVVDKIIVVNAGNGYTGTPTVGIAAP